MLALLLLGALLTAGACGSQETTTSGSPTPTTTPGGSPSTTATSRPPARPIAGFPAPDFELNSLDGPKVSLSSFRGQPVVLNFWATWCSPCRHEIPFLQDIAMDPDWLDRGLEMVAVDIQESEGDVRQFMEANGMTYRVLLDRSGAVASLYNIRGIPTTFFIDKDGIIQNVKVGTFQTKQEIEAIIKDTILAE